jgi:transposase
MAVLNVIAVKESIEELQQLFRKATRATRPRLKMLLLIRKGVLSTQVLAAKTGVSMDTIGHYKKRYSTQGLSALLQERRGAHQQGAISRAQHQLLKQQLADPKGGFTSYKQLVQWINETFGLSMRYHAVNKYVKRHFHTKLKVGRKTHVQKDPLAAAVFKKRTTGQTPAP